MTYRDAIFISTDSTDKVAKVDTTASGTAFVVAKLVAGTVRVIASIGALLPQEGAEANRSPDALQQL